LRRLIRIERVVDHGELAVRIEGLRKVTGSLQGSGDRCQRLCGVGLPGAFIVEEEKRSISSVIDPGQADRTADRPAKDVTLEVGYGRPRLIGEPIIRIEPGVTLEIVNHPVQVIGAAFGYDINNRATGIPEFGIKEVSLNLELLNHINRRLIL